MALSRPATDCNTIKALFSGQEEKRLRKRHTLFSHIRDQIDTVGKQRHGRRCDFPPLSFVPVPWKIDLLRNAIMNGFFCQRNSNRLHRYFSVDTFI